MDGKYLANIAGETHYVAFSAVNLGCLEELLCEPYLVLQLFMLKHKVRMQWAYVCYIFCLLCLLYVQYRHYFKSKLAFPYLKIVAGAVQSYYFVVFFKELFKDIRKPGTFVL